MRKKAFTLIELLVVISIIALLLSIMMPALARVREQARGLVCKTNLRQWGTILMLYAAGNSDYFPTGWNIAAQDEGYYAGDERLRRANWMAHLLPYYQNPEIRLCPSAKVMEGTIGAVNRAWGPLENDQYYIKDSSGEYPYGSYGLNGWTRSVPHVYNEARMRQVARGYGPDAFWQRTSRLRRPDNIPLFIDSNWWNIQAMHTDPPVTRQQAELGTGGTNHWSHVCMKRHRAGVNAVMGDGSAVDILPLNGLWTYNWSTRFNTRSYSLIDWTNPDFEWLAR